MAENLNKLTTLEQLKAGLTAAKNYTDTQDAALLKQIEDIADEVDGIVATGGQANVLEGVKVNGTALDIADKMVDILIAEGTTDGTISVNGVDVAIHNLKALAFASEVTEDMLAEALKAKIASLATQSDLEALGGRVEKLENNEAGYQTAAQVSTAIQAAISASGHAHFEKVDAVPSAETAEDNVLYLVMNAETNHYDIYAKVGTEVVLIDDTTVDLSAYATTEAMNGAISDAIEALKIGDYAKASDLAAAVERIAAVETKFNDYYTKTEIDGIVEQAAEDIGEDIAAVDAKFADYTKTSEMDSTYATDAQAQEYAANAVANALATDEEVTTMLGEVFPANNA